MISGFRLKGPCSSVRGKYFISAVKFKQMAKCVVNEKYLDKYKKQKYVRQNLCWVGSLLQYTYIQSYKPVP